MNKFWNWIDAESGERELRIEGVIADNATWLDDSITPKIFRDELNAADGDITVWINSEGGDVFAAVEIYSMLKGYRGKVTIKITALAASSASVVAMAGDEVQISPAGMIMIHNPWTCAQGDSDEFKSAAQMLDDIKESIINAYEQKTHLSRDEISRLMDEETWLPANKAIELGFADKIMFSDDKQEVTQAYSRKRVMNSATDKNGGLNMTLEDLKQQMELLMREMEEFLDDHANENGTLADADAKTYFYLEKKLRSIREKIYLQEAHEEFKAILPNPNSSPLDALIRHRRGVVGTEYHRKFIQAFRTNFKHAQNFLQETNSADGGFLVPEEFDAQLVKKLDEGNVLRQISKVITTATTHKINIAAAEPTASWVAEGGEITLSKAQFSQKNLAAFKIAAGCKISNELLADSYFDLESELIEMFSRAISTAEEESFINGKGETEPLGILKALSATASSFITSRAAEITADDVITLYYSLDRPYRRNAVFLASDSAIANLRRLRDTSQNFLWSNSLVDGEPPTLLGAKVYSTPHMPAVSSGEVPILFGDFADYFVIGDRGERVVKPLRELYALNDLTGFLMIQRVDCCLTDLRAVKGLKMK